MHNSNNSNNHLKSKNYGVSTVFGALHASHPILTRTLDALYFCFRDEKTGAQRLSEVPKTSNWQNWVQSLSQNDPRPGIQAEIFNDSNITMDTSLLIYLTSV